MIDRVTEYARKTINENKMGELHILACKRHLEDLKRQLLDAVYDEKK